MVLKEARRASRREGLSLRGAGRSERVPAVVAAV
jgi:hypothetical protein